MGEHLELWTTVDNSGLQWTTIVYAMDYNVLQWTTVVYSGLHQSIVDYSGFRHSVFDLVNLVQISDPSSLHVMSNLQCPDMMSGRRVNPNPDIREREREREGGRTWYLVDPELVSIGGFRGSRLGVKSCTGKRRSQPILFLS